MKGERVLICVITALVVFSLVGLRLATFLEKHRPPPAIVATVASGCMQ